MPIHKERRHDRILYEAFTVLTRPRLHSRRKLMVARRQVQETRGAPLDGQLPIPISGDEASLEITVLAQILHRVWNLEGEGKRTAHLRVDERLREGNRRFNVDERTTSPRE